MEKITSWVSAYGEPLYYFDDLTCRASNIVSNLGIKSRKEMREWMKTNSLMRVRNCGKKTYKEIFAWAVSTVNEDTAPSKYAVMEWLDRMAEAGAERFGHPLLSESYIMAHEAIRLLKSLDSLPKSSDKSVAGSSGSRPAS